MAGSSTSFGVWALSLSACGGLLAAVSSDGRLEVRRQEAKPGGQAAAASCRLVSRGLVQLHEAPRPEAAAAGAETRRPRRRRRQHPTARPRRRRTWRCAWSPSTRTQPIANGSPALGPQGCLRASACLAGSRAENTLLYELHEIDTHARPSALLGVGQVGVDGVSATPRRPVRHDERARAAPPNSLHFMVSSNYVKIRPYTHFGSDARSRRRRFEPPWESRAGGRGLAPETGG